MMANREADMKQAMKVGQNLVLNADSSSPEVTSLRQEVKEIPDRYTDLKNQLTEQQAQLERIIQDSSAFQQQIRELELWVTEVSESTAMQEPISTNPKVVNKRLEQTEVSKDKLYVLMLTGFWFAFVLQNILCVRKVFSVSMFVGTHLVEVRNFKFKPFWLNR